MRNYFKKTFVAFLSLALIITTIDFSSFSVNAEETIEDMVASATYNLALKKTATANPSRQEGSEAALTDGKLTSEHAATTFGTAGTYFLVDLGKVYSAAGIESIVVQYKEMNAGDVPMKGYQIQYSMNGVDYRTVKTVTAADMTANITAENLTDVQDVEGSEGNVRYVKIFYPDSYTWGIQVREIAVLDTDGDIEEGVIEKCADPAAVTVSSDDYNTVKYEITAGEDQEDFTYAVYLDDGTQLAAGVLAGTEYTVSGVKGGTHTLKVTSLFGEKISEGIESEKFDVKDISDIITSANNVASHKNNPLSSIYSMSSIYEGHSLTTALKALDGNTKTGEGSDVALRTGSGSPQTVVVDLGQYYVPDNFTNVALLCTNAATYVGGVKVEFSKDAKEYVRVGMSSGYTYSQSSTISKTALSEIANYEEEAVRFVRLTFAGGSSNWGYVVNEIAIATDDNGPQVFTPDVTDAADIVITSEKLDNLIYQVVAGENQEGYTYSVNIDGVEVNGDVTPGESYSVDIEEGNHDVAVFAHNKGWVSAGIEKTYNVEGYSSYIKSSLNIVYKGVYPDVQVSCPQDNYGENYCQGSQDISAGVGVLNNGVINDNGHHTGYLQTRSDSDTADIFYVLEKPFDKDLIHSVLSVFESAGTAATEYEILFSADGEKYESVLHRTNVKWKKLQNDKIDMSKYTQETVQYVQFKILAGRPVNNLNADGSINWGSDSYHLNELAVFADQAVLPENVTGLTVVSEAFNDLQVSWVDNEDPNCTYSVYIDGNRVDTDIPAGVQHKQFIVGRGNHTVKVTTKSDTFESLGVSATTFVDAETTTTTPKPTTVAPTTKAPATQAPTTTKKPVVYTTTTEKDEVDNTKTPGKVTLSKAVNVKKKSIKITIKKAKNAKSYMVQYDTNKKFKKAKSKEFKKLTFTIKKLKKGKKYFVRVCGLNEGKMGKWSTVKKVVIKK